MTETVLLVPIRYPLTESGIETVRRALELAADHENSHLYVLHVNLLHKDERVTRDGLASAVTRELGPLQNASFQVRSAFSLEEAILYEAVKQDADRVIIGSDTGSRWRRVLSDCLAMDVDLERFLREHLNEELLVV